MYAAKHGYVEVVEALVEHRDPSARVSIYIYIHYKGLNKFVMPDTNIASCPL